MASSSCSLPNNPSNPTARASYEDVVANKKLFMDTLVQLHSEMGTTIKIPYVDRKKLDLHKLFVEVTSRGGFNTINKNRQWSEVTATFNLPPTQTSASNTFRKSYFKLIYDYEQIYAFKLPCPITPVRGTIRQPVKSPQPKTGSADLLGASAGSQVAGVIDGKFDDGYLVTITIGSETLKGVLYENPYASSASQAQQNCNTYLPSAQVVGTARRKRRKKCEIKRKDPALPKPNRNGYNFFFAEQQPLLKLKNPEKHREITKMIGELWSGMDEQQKSVYEEKAVEDKERYRVEKEEYRKRFKSGQVISNAVPLQQRSPQQNSDMVEAEKENEEDEPSGSSSKSVLGDHQNCVSDPNAVPLQQCSPQQNIDMVDAEEGDEEEDESSGSSSESVPGDHQDCVSPAYQDETL